jgi:hypothetical protein
MAFGMLAVALTICWCFFHKFHTIKNSDASSMVVVGAVASIGISVYLILCWKRKWVWVRSSRIIRSADPFSYWIAMLAFGLIDFAFLLAFALSCYVLSKSSA